MPVDRIHTNTNLLLLLSVPRGLMHLLGNTGFSAAPFPSFKNRGPRTGVTGAVSQSDAANNQKERDTSDKSLIVDIRILLEHQKRSVHWLIILATALICRGVILKKSEI